MLDLNWFRAHQTHYEQMGVARGTVTINGKLYPFNIDSMRDHSYGRTAKRLLVTN